MQELIKLQNMSANYESKAEDMENSLVCSNSFSNRCK